MELTAQTLTPSRLLAKTARRGFTLVELIVVISIIATLLAVGVGTIKNVAGSKGVSTGVSLAEGIFEHARSIAKASGGSRLLVYCDESGDNKELREKYLRLIVLQKPDPDNPEEWILAGPGISLPTDTFFNANLSKVPESNKESAIFPGSSTPKTCYTYEFNSSGYRASGDAGINTLFILQSGQLLPGQTVPRSLPKRKRDVGGFRIWKTGKISVFRSPDQMEDYTNRDIGFE